MGSSVTGARSYALRSPTRLPSVAIMGVTFMGSETFQSNLENRFAAVETTTDGNQNLMDVVRVLREEGTRLCEMQRKGWKSKLSEETLGLMKERRENPPVTSSAKRTLNREISKHVRRDLRCSNALDIERAIEQNRGQAGTHRVGRHVLERDGPVAQAAQLLPGAGAQHAQLQRPRAHRAAHRAAALPPAQRALHRAEARRRCRQNAPAPAPPAAAPPADHASATPAETSLWRNNIMRIILRPQLPLPKILRHNFI
ncbi:hypothetical protein ACJJTC_010788 [Scirpophaga incertulas]